MIWIMESPDEITVLVSAVHEENDMIGKLLKEKESMTSNDEMNDET